MVGPSRDAGCDAGNEVWRMTLRIPPSDGDQFSMREELSGPACIQRALIASEIAESCRDSEIRASFLALTQDWLQQAVDLEHRDHQDGRRHVGDRASD